MYYRVTKYNDLIDIIIPHFYSYPLLSLKTIIFSNWVKAVELLASGQHKSKNGFLEILSIYAAIGRGPSNKIKSYFPDLVPAKVPEYNLAVADLNPWWLSGYLTIYCHFELAVYAGQWYLDVYNKLRHSFSISRDISELKLINLIGEYLGVKIYIRTENKRVDLYISSLPDCQVLIKFLDLYPLQSSKQQEYLIWRKFIYIAIAFNSKNPKLAGNLDENISIFFDLIKKLDRIREEN